MVFTIIFILQVRINILPTPEKNPIRIVIIGAGIIGATIAYYLSCRPNCAVTIIDRTIPGSGASGHSFAWVNAFGKDPRDYHTLNRRSLDMWYRLERNLDVDVGIHYGGEMRWECNRERALLLQSRIRQLQTWGYLCRLISEEEMLDLEPDLCPGHVEIASYSEADIHIETDKYINVCLEKARESGTEIYTNTNVIDFTLYKRKIKSVITSKTELLCDIVILASGVETTQLASSVGVNVPQQRSPGIVIKTTQCPKVLHNVAVIHAPPIEDNLQYLHLRQLNDTTLRIGQGTQEGINRDDSQEHADTLLANAKEYIPTIGNVHAIPTPIGYRPMPLDGYPIIGFTNAIQNMYIALMHSGVTLAPIVGEMATLEVVDGVDVDWFKPYRLDRFE